MFINQKNRNPEALKIKASESNHKYIVYLREKYCTAWFVFI
ncbi:Uncharacterized [Moorella glycerini]|uniref:Uncharacterized protein n=1 Tax=Neomoorella stamsii TaxID=1266720 RepID=A0A9X7J340_9FIRM|nr:hypothetical protein MOST_21760 [Moorella stamsii]CEP66068.1 Uncharacterized [Moorella glycerini]